MIARQPLYRYSVLAHDRLLAAHEELLYLTERSTLQEQTLDLANALGQ